MLIADTGPLVAMLNAKDRHHEACTALFRRFRGPIIVPAPIASGGWHEISPGYWGFRAIGDRVCTDTEIDAAYAAGDLPLRPGDDCPTRAGGAYRPHWL